MEKKSKHNIKEKRKTKEVQKNEIEEEMTQYGSGSVSCACAIFEWTNGLCIMVGCSAHIQASNHSQDYAPKTMTGFKCEFCTDKKR